MRRFLPAKLAALVARTPRRPLRRPLAVESLEARDVPASYTWTPTAPGAYDWNDAANWSGGPAGTFPNAVDDVANLTGALVGNQVVRLNTGITIGTLNLGSTSTAGGFTVLANGGSLTFDVTAGSATLDDTNTGGDAVLAPVTVNDNLTVTGGGTRRLNLGLTLAGGTGTVSTTGNIALTSDLTTPAAVPLTGTGTIAAHQTLFVTSYYDSALYQFDATTGNLLATLIAPNGAGPLVLPAGMTTGPDGNLYVSSQFSDSILKYDRATQTVSTFIDSTTLNAIANLPANGGNSNFRPAGLRFGPDGNLYVSLNGGISSASGAVIRFGVANAGGVLSYNGTNTAVLTGVPQPSGLSFGPAGTLNETDLYVTNASGGVIRVAGATGATPTPSSFITPGSGGLEFPSAITFGPGGKAYVVDLGAFTGAGKILRYNPDGSFDTTFVGPGTGANPGDLAGQFPSDGLFDAAGNYLTAILGFNGPTTGHPHDFSGSVYRYTAAGSFSTALVSSAMFPQTGPDATYNGIIASQLAAAAAGTLTVGSSLNVAGAGTGTLTVPNVTFTAAATYTATLNGTSPGTGYDELTSTGTVNLGGATLSVGFGASFPVGTQFTLIASAAPVVGTFAGLPEGATISNGGEQYVLTYHGGASGHDVVLTRTANTAPAITSADNTTFFTGRNNTFQMTATGFPAPTFSVPPGSLPAGVTLSPSGLLSGSPTSGTATVTVTATNGVGTDATQTFTLNVVTGVAPAVTSPNHAEINSTTGGTFAVTATGTPTPTLAETATLPSGVTFDPASGVLTVAPGTINGVYSLTFTADNGVAPAASQSFTLTVGTPPTAFSSANSATFYSGTSNTFTVSANGSPVPTYSLFSGTLPGTVTLDSTTGVLSGDPGTPGSYPVTIRATNALGHFDQSFTLTVDPGSAPAVTSADHAGFTVGAANTFTVTATGGPPPTFTETGALPTGVSLSPAGVLAGTPAAGTSGVYPISIKATNSLGTDTQPFTLTVGTPPAITSANNTLFFTGKNNTFTVTATGSPAPTFTETGALPGGVTLSPAGVLSGTPAATGSFPITITADNGVGTPAHQSFNLTVVAGAAPAIVSADHAAFTTGTGGTFTVLATGTPTPTLAETATPPAGVTFTPATGVLAVGPAAAAGTYTLTFTADNGVGTPASQTFTLTVGTAPAVTSADHVTFTWGQTTTFFVTATGSPTPALAETGPLPAGVTFSPVTGALTGSAADLGTFPVTFTATNALGTATQAFTLTVVAPPMTIAPATLPAARAGVPYTATLVALGGPDPDSFGQAAGATFAVTAGTLPAGLTLSPGGVLGGTPTAVGTFSFTVTATDAPSSATQQYTLTVGLPQSQTTFPRLVAGGPTDGAAAAFDPDATGKYPTTPTATLSPFGTIPANVRTAVADVDGDGVPDTILVTGPGTPVRFAVISGKDDKTVLVPPTDPFGGNFTGGGFVSAADFDGDGRAEVVITPDQGGGPNVVLFSLKPDGTLATPKAFFALGNPSFRGGARSAAGDLNGDGVPDLVVGAGFLGGPVVEVHDGKALAAGDFATLIGSGFFAFDGTDAQTLRNGVFLAAGDVNGDGFADLIVGGGPGGGPRVLVLDGKTLSTKGATAAQAAPLANFFYGDGNSRGGVRVAATSVAGSTKADIVVGSGEGLASAVRVYPGANVTPAGEPTGFQDLDPFGQVLPGGVFVG
jgi:hypothetical protein